MTEQTQTILGGQCTFHWPLEYPQIFLYRYQNKSGFDVVIGNPPFLGGSKISGELRSSFLEYLFTAFHGAHGISDICAYFFRKGYEIIKNDGLLGLVATNTIGQGDTRETGLGWLSFYELSDFHILSL